jgi:hypothetical protein
MSVATTNEMNALSRTSVTSHARVVKFTSQPVELHSFFERRDVHPHSVFSSPNDYYLDISN